MKAMEENRWTTENSEVYRQLAQVAVPFRTEQIATLLTLMPFPRESVFRVVELASGEGYLSQAILQAFPNAQVLALDGDESMRQATLVRLAGYGSRGSVEAFDMYKPDWYELAQDADVLVSSLCVHHLNGTEKQALFHAVYKGLSERGALLFADLVRPMRSEANELFAATWDRTARTQAAERGEPAAYEAFQREHWNLYRHPDPFDKPSGLFEQLLWLNEAGFVTVDCFWMHAGHAIYGGYKQESGETFTGIPFEEALRVAKVVLDV